MPKKMPVWLVVLISVIVVLTLLLISPLSNPIKRPLAKKFSELWSTRYQLDSPRAKHRAKAIRLIPYNKKYDDALLLQLTRMAVTDSDATVRNLAMAKVYSAAQNQTIPSAAMQILTDKLQDRQDPHLPDILNYIGGMANKHNRYDNTLIMDISRIAEDKAKDHLGNTAIGVLGNIGAQQPLPDASVEILTRVFQKIPNAYNVPQAFGKITKQRPLPEATLSALLTISQNHKRYNVRAAAIKALAAHCHKHPCKAGWFQPALEDKHQYVRQETAKALFQMVVRTKGEKQALIDVLGDKTRHAEIRRYAARHIPYKYQRGDDDIKALRLSLADDPDASLRLVAIVYYTRLDRKQHQTDPVWLQRIKKALADPDLRNRKQAIHTLINMGFKDSTKATLLVSAMQDQDAKVRIRAIGYISPAYYKDPTLRAALDKATTDPVAKVQRLAKSKKKGLEYRASGAYEKKRKSRKNKNKIAQGIFWFIVILSGGIAIGYLVYYVIRFIIYLAQRSWKAAITVLVIVGWFAASAGMAYGLIIAIFGLGGRHGQFSVLLGLFVATLVYAAIGWGLRYPIRR